MDAQKRVVRVADKIQLDKIHPLAYRTILRTGMRLNGETFGLLKDENDQPLREEDGSPYICNGQYGGSGPDHTELRAPLITLDTHNITSFFLGEALT